MRVIRHYSPGEEIVAYGIKLEQRLLNNPGNSRLFEKTVSVSQVKILFDPSLQYDSLLILIQLKEFLLPSCYYILRN